MPVDTDWDVPNIFLHEQSCDCGLTMQGNVLAMHFQHPGTPQLTRIPSSAEGH